MEIDCAIIGAGPVGSLAATYLARYRRQVRLLDAGDPRAAWIPYSHNYPGQISGVVGTALVAQMHAQALHYGIRVEPARVERLVQRPEGGFLLEWDGGEVAARTVILATGVVDVEPSLPNLPDAVRRGLIRHCPICDGFEVIGHRVAVMGHGRKGIREALFIRTYTEDLTLLTLGEALSADDRALLDAAGICVVEDALDHVVDEGTKIGAIRLSDGRELIFDTLYSALGSWVRSHLALALGAKADAEGGLIVDDHCQTSVPGLFAAGDVVSDLNQIVVGYGHAAKAATRIHNLLRGR